MRRGFAALLSFALLACSGAPSVPTPAPGRAPVASTSPRLVVLLVIDQLPEWMFDRDRARFTGGLARLLREAAVGVADLPYASSFTAPGHATIGTGAPPRVHGVIGNQWYRRPLGTERPAEDDPDAPTLPLVEGSRVEGNGSSRALRVDGIADELRRATGGRAHSVAIALKARAACMMAGRRPDLAIWFDESAGGMTTSRAYAETTPAWLHELATTHPASRFVGQTWTPLDAKLLARAATSPDEGPGEGDMHGMGIAFPHPVRDLDAIVHTPFGDQVVLDAVYAALGAMQLGADDVPDLLAVSFNAHDYAGHNWGPDSWEVLDLTLRLDAALGELFATLDRTVGTDRWALVLTSDHGATPLVERSPHEGARRVPTKELAAVAEQAIASSLGAGPWVAKISANNLYLTDRWRALPPESRAGTLAAAVAALRAVPGIGNVQMTRPYMEGCEETTGLERGVCNAVAVEASGELYLAAAPGSLITDYTTGTHHDAPNPDNLRVPVIVRAPGAKLTVGPATLLQVAPTVAALLGVPPPPAATAAPLFGLAARSPARP